MSDPFAQVSRRRILELSVATAATLGLAACSASDHGSTATTTTASGDPADIAADAYIFGYPLVLSDLIRETAGPANEFVHQIPSTSESKQVVGLNPDTLYSQAWLNLRPEPMVLQVPPIEAGRYWVMQFLDAWTNTVHDPSSTNPRVKNAPPHPPYTYLVTGPGWKGTIPDGMTQLSVPTGTTCLLGRIEYKGAGDVEHARALQQQLKLAPLSVWNSGAAQGGPGAQAAGGGVPAQMVAGMDGPAFFARMCALMELNPPSDDDSDAIKRFATIGVTPGGAPTLPANTLTAAIAAGKAQLAAYRDPHSQQINGWSYNLEVGTYGTDYLLRAQVAVEGPGANLPRDAVYPTVNANAERGSRFRVTFEKNAMPPVGAFWSLTAYDAQSYLVQNSAGIYSVGHLIPLTPAADGTVRIAVQNADPGTEVTAGHWLPIPESGPFSLTMRLYAPKDTVLNGKWEIPKLVQLS
ncbi:DUF1254 domain-containing protein [Nocardia tengchongensis]|uniref:DUF1254 domain-containing protein n=1 Tax=Nocardia tengchongensis TaxID=2055889 RepID=UPI0036C2C1FD